MTTRFIPTPSTLFTRSPRIGPSKILITRLSKRECLSQRAIITSWMSIFHINIFVFCPQHDSFIFFKIIVTRPYRQIRRHPHITASSKFTVQIREINLSHRIYAQVTPHASIITGHIRGPQPLQSHISINDLVSVGSSNISLYKKVTINLIPQIDSLAILCCIQLTNFQILKIAIHIKVVTYQAVIGI